jgi:hypothetical protein
MGTATRRALRGRCPILRLSLSPLAPPGSYGCLGDEVIMRCPARGSKRLNSGSRAMDAELPLG